MEKYSSFAGKSMPMGEKIPNFSMIGVYDKQPAGIKFVKIHTKHLEGKFSVILVVESSRIRAPHSQDPYLNSIASFLTQLCEASLAV